MTVKTPRALVTGGAGFVGSSLCARLIERKFEVLCVDDLSLGTERHIEGLGKKRGFEFQKWDVARPGWYEKLKGRSFDLLVHLAANSDISVGRENPASDRDRTFSTTFEALMAAKALRIPDFIFSSSSAVYGIEPVLPTPESASGMHPVSIYGAGKLASEAYISAFVENYGLRAWIFRFGNVVGRRLTHGVILDFVAKLRRDPSRLEVLGDGRQNKTYIDVEDCVDGILRAYEKSPPGKSHAQRLQIFNLSTDGATSVREIAQGVSRAVTGGKAELRFGSSPTGWVGDVPKTLLDVSKMLSLGWRPRLDSSAAVAKSIEDFIEWSSAKDARKS